MDMHTILLLCAAIGTPFWLVERFRAVRCLAPWSQGVLGFAVSLVPIAALLLITRSFVVEPYVVPSSSMRPGLEVGDFVLVDKLTYGLRLPLSNKLVWNVSTPNRADILVFRFPLDRSKAYIKRVIGLPGDIIEYKAGILYINNKIVDMVGGVRYEYVDGDSGVTTIATSLTQRIDQIPFDILSDAQDKELGRGSDFPEITGCERKPEGVKCLVPKDAFFVLGDNRRDSLDSRYWGFVHQTDIIGRALYSVSIDRLNIRIKRITN